MACRFLAMTGQCRLRESCHCHKVSVSLSRTAKAVEDMCYYEVDSEQDDFDIHEYTREQQYSNYGG